MSAQTLLSAIQAGAERFRVKGEPGVFEINGPVTHHGRSWIARVHKLRSKVYAHMGSANARMWEVVAEVSR